MNDTGKAEAYQAAAKENQGDVQNSYLIQDDKMVLIDTIWVPHQFEFAENLKQKINLKQIGCIVVNHGKIDHFGALTALMAEIPDTLVYCTTNTVKSPETQVSRRRFLRRGEIGKIPVEP